MLLTKARRRVAVELPQTPEDDPLEQCVEGGRANCDECICVVSHGYGGLGGGRDGGGGWQTC